MKKYAIDLDKLQSVPVDEAGWFTMQNIVQAYPDVPERTIRDALKRLRDKLETQGEKRGRKYRLKQFVPADTRRTFTVAEKDKAYHYDMPFSANAMQALAYIEQSKVFRSPVEYNPQWLSAYRPNHSFYLPENSRKHLEAIGKQSGIPGQAGTYVLKIFDQLLLDVSYNSSRMEGNTYTKDEVSKLIQDNVKAPDRTAEETTMILNHKDAIEYLVRRVKDDYYTLDNITTLHALLSENLVDYGYSGMVRDKDVLIGDSVYVPLSGESAGKQTIEQQLILIIEKSNAIHNVFERAVFVLLHISYLQAFIDVNKRTARLASVLPMIKNDYIPISFVGVDQKTYATCLICFYETGQYLPMVEYFVACYEKSCHQFSEAAKLVGWDEFGAKYRRQRREMLASIILQKILLENVEAFVMQNLPVDIEQGDRQAFCAMIKHSAESLALPQIAGIGVSRQEYEQWVGLNGGKVDQ